MGCQYPRSIPVNISTLHEQHSNKTNTNHNNNNPQTGRELLSVSILHDRMDADVVQWFYGKVIFTAVKISVRNSCSHQTAGRFKR